MAPNCKQCLNTNLLVILTLIGGTVGLALGFSMRKLKISKDTLLWTGILGEVYIRMLKMMIIPLIVSSIITATSSLDIKTNGKISIVSFTFMMVTNTIPCILGTFLCLIIQPGLNVHIAQSMHVRETDIETQDIFADLLRNIFPENVIVSTFEKAQTKYFIDSSINKSSLDQNNTLNISSSTKSKIIGSADGTNVLGLIVASCLFGMATSASNEHGKAFSQFFTSATHVILQLLRWLMWFTPIGVASLLARTIASSADASDEFRHLGMFIATVLTGISIWSFIAVPVTYFMVKKTNPFRFLYSLTEPMLIVFATSSTAIAMPETFHSLEVTNKLDKRVTRFVIPLSATIGRSGTCLYMNVSCLFVIQLVGMELTASRLILVCVLSTLSALAAPPVTGSCLVNIILILTTLDIPPEAAALLYAFDWILDRCRSITNLFTNALCVVITCEMSKSVLEQSSQEETEDNLLDVEIKV